ncbi:hypothetical protein [Actinoallomurus bryophytorum]
MRSAAELRQRWLDLVPLMIARAGMYTTSGGAAVDIQLRGLLADLCFLDEREGDLDSTHEVIRRYGKLGVVGPFAAMFGNEGNYVAEVASVWAEQFHRLGYLQVDRVLDARAWDQLITGLAECFDGKDVRRSEVEATFGPPSLVADRRVLCYAPTDGSGWVFVDCYTEWTNRYVTGSGRYEGERDNDPLVRSVRHPTQSFEAGLILTLYGKVLRWGPGWWQQQPSGLTEEQQAIAVQLRRIEAADPSQALKSPRGHPRRASDI